MNMFLYYLYTYTCTEDTQSILQEEILRKKTVGSVVAVILQPLCVLYLVTLLISSCILLSIARLHILASFQNMVQIIALGVTCEY